MGVVPVSVMLPQEKSEVNRKFEAQTFGVIGAPGIGKSTFFQYANALYIQTESGLNHLSVFKLPCRSWAEAEAIKSALLKAKQAGPLPYSMVVIDTIDEFVKLADERTVERIHEKFPQKKDDVQSIFDYPAASDKGNPAWGWRRDYVMNYLKDLAMNLGVAVGYIGHMEHKDVKTPTQTFHKQTISIGGQLGTDLISWPDHFLTITAEKSGGVTKRYIRTITDATLDAKSRGLMVPDKFEITEDTKANWERFRKLFD